jgi:hypothetical protein
MNLARPLRPGNANDMFASRSDRLKLEFGSTVATRRERNNRIPALKRRAKFIPTLRVEEFSTLGDSWRREGGSRYQRRRPPQSG